MKLIRIASKDLADTIAGLQWLELDAKEAFEIANWDIPTLILRQQKVEPINFIVEHENKVLSIIIIDLAGNLTYFNTVDMKDYTLSYLRYLKPQLEAYCKLFDIELTVDVMNWYTTSEKKLKLLGFKRIGRYEDRISYGKSV